MGRERVGACGRRPVGRCPDGGGVWPKAVGRCPDGGGDAAGGRWAAARWVHNHRFQGDEDPEYLAWDLRAMAFVSAVVLWTGHHS